MHVSPRLRRLRSDLKAMEQLNENQVNAFKYLERKNAFLPQRIDAWKMKQTAGVAQVGMMQ